MKSILVLLCFAFLGVLATELPPNEKQKLQRVHNDCQANRATYVDEDILRNLSQHLDNPHASAHMLCMSVGAGLQNKNGDFQKDVIKSKINIFEKNPAKADAILSKCAVKSDNPGKTASKLFICLNQNNVKYVHEL